MYECINLAKLQSGPSLRSIIHSTHIHCDSFRHASILALLSPQLIGCYCIAREGVT